MKILCVGPQWRGSNAGGLFRALSRKGEYIDVVDEYYYLSFHASDIKIKVLQKLIRPLQVKEFNKAITDAINLFKPDVLFIYKGAFVVPQTLHYAKKKNCRLVLFYPDVSMTAHGGYLPQDIPLYELVFTTKTFGIRDLKDTFGVSNTIFIPHGFDPDIHRMLNISEKDKQTFGCDVSFIGTYSPKKEQLLAVVRKAIPDINLKIWGNQWSRSSEPVLKDCIQHTAVSGDMYAIAIQCSKINLGILSEKVSGASSGDLITSRTFHIPGSAGFLLHEKNEESVDYFMQDAEAGFFDGEEDLVAQVKKYLADDALRERVRMAGYQRALKDHSLDARAAVVIDHLKQMR